MQNTLFDLHEEQNIIPSEQRKITKERCKNCDFIYNHTYGKMKYCSKQKDTRTAYGHKKIKANDPACIAFTNSEI